MWNLIPTKNMPPARFARYCCAELKETSGVGRVTVTGVRWDESKNRQSNQGFVTFAAKRKEITNSASELGVNISSAKKGLVMNDDNDPARRLVEQCYRTHKTLVNPIIDWSDEEVWEFLNDVAKVPHCSLYDEGYKRIGCIGCPLSHNAEAELEAWPTYKKAYLNAFGRMLQQREARGAKDRGWKTPKDVMDWWLLTNHENSKSVEGQLSLFDMEDEE